MYIKKLTFSFAVLFMLSALFCSCVQNVPEVKSAYATIIFDYSENSSLPKARLSVIAESESDVRRYSQMNLYSENGYVWTAQDLLCFSSEGKMYVAFTNFVVPEGEQLPLGNYSILLETADGEEIEYELKLDYDTAFYNLSAEKIPPYFSEQRGGKTIVIYDKNNSVIYYGERKSELESVRKIWNKYSNAAMFQEVWKASDGSAMCLMPFTEVTPGQEN